MMFDDFILTDNLTDNPTPLIKALTTSISEQQPITALLLASKKFRPCIIYLPAFQKSIWIAELSACQSKITNTEYRSALTADETFTLALTEISDDNKAHAEEV